ncbi:MAG TPA: GAF domain-containing sensor histidine kinase, partial [Anaeromyxobacteraceae bacterium]|nr:GAF domain-containing sensor histidine kinase [Anaeromyxobacteraceae bacterium]
MTDRAEALAEIGTALSSTLDLDALLSLAVERAVDLLEADRGTLFLVDRARGELWSKVLKGGRTREIRLPAGQGIAGHVARTGRPASVPDAYLDPRFDRAVDQGSGYRTRSLLAVPLRDRHGATAGVLEVLNRRGGPFSAADERLLAAVASQAAVALENARLFAEAEKRNAELELLLGLERRLAEAPDLAAGLGAVLERALEVVEADAGAVLVREGRGGDLFFRSARGGRPEALRRLAIPPGRGIAGAVVQRGRPILANDTSAERAFDPALAERIGYEVKSALCVPLQADGETFGALELLNKRGGFTAEDQALLSVVAGQTARVVEVGRAREERGREERLATIGQLLSGVLHDLRTPLTIISGWAQLMAGEADPAERQKAVALILRQLEAVEAMTREVLDFARGSVAVLKRSVLVNVFMREVAGYLEKDLEGRGVELRVRVGYGGPARFDEVKVKRALFNVARNAAEAMPQGGRFALSVARTGERLVFRMSDTGPGIPEALRGRLFESFASHGKAHGTGLGLAIVKRIAEEHGGTVECRSRPGKGTTFVLAIPA